MKLRVLKLDKKQALVAVQSKEIHGSYRVEIVNSNGLFGVEYPPKLGAVLNRFPKESRELINELRDISIKV